MATSSVTFQLRRGLSTGPNGWTAVNPILAAGEPGIELDTDTLKIGDGTTAWLNLPVIRNGTTTALGSGAGFTGQQIAAVAIGIDAGKVSQNGGAIGIGYRAGMTFQQVDTIAIGGQAGMTFQKRESIAIGLNAGADLQQELSIAIGPFAGNANQGGLIGRSIAIGAATAKDNQGKYSIAIGGVAGYTGQQEYSIALGAYAGYQVQGATAIAMGFEAGYTGQGTNSIAIGTNAGKESQGGPTGFSIAIGDKAGSFNQGYKSIAIGNSAGNKRQGNNSIAIGHEAGYDVNGLTFQSDNSIIINASGASLVGVSGVSGLYVAPIRDISGITLESRLPLTYNTSTKEIFAMGLSGPIITGSLLPSKDNAFDLGGTGIRFRDIFAVSATINTNTLNMVAPGSITPTMSMSYYNGAMMFSDHDSKSVSAVGYSGTVPSYNEFFGPTGIFGLPPGSTFNRYKIKGLTYFNGGSDSTIQMYIMDGGLPDTGYKYYVDGNLSGVRI